MSRHQIVIKGVLTAEDANEALQHGVDGIWVSNHGGRQLDSLPGTIEVLPEVGYMTSERGPTNGWMD